MIVARIEGGLGNQMFQYAYGLYLAERHQTELVLDLSAYQDVPQHGYLLDKFRIQARADTGEFSHRIPPRYRPTGTHPQRWRQVLDLITGKTLKRHKERPFGFAEPHLRVSNNRYLVGYWQSERYFPGLRNKLLREFTLKQALSGTSARVALRMRDCDSLALHVRRGDYVSDSSAAQIYEHLGPEYYHRAVEDFSRSTASPELFVFSNDIAWCKQNLQLRLPTHWVDHNDVHTAHEDLVLMSQAAGCVIANSTFSWWAAWLNTRPNKKVYAPKNWFRPGTLDGTHLICEDWQRVCEPEEFRSQVA